MKRIILSTLILFLFACGQNAQEAQITIDTLTFNGENIEIAEDNYRYEHDRIYLATNFLDKQMHLKLQVLVPGQQIGICTDDLCIPFSLYDPENVSDTASLEGAAFKSGESFYIPIAELMTSLGGTSEWDAGSNTLSVQFKK